jgi:sulfate/thiosulfate transport system substrate-binding protein
MPRIKVACVAAVVAALAAAAAAFGGSSASAAKQDVKLTLAAYSTPRDAYARIIPAFQKTQAGRDVSFQESYGSSGEQARAVLNGLKADAVALSLEPDVTDLVRAGLVSKGWNRGRYRGMVTNSVVVFVVRDGNPNRIRTWNDLIRKGIEVITPNPFTSGGARWNVMAAYGAQRKDGKTHKQAVAYLLKLFKNVSVQDKSARESLQTFASGKGDVLLAYENEALFAKQKGQRLQFVIPRNTILIENPVAIVSKSEHQREARAFVNFLRSSTAQTIFAQNGYRPVVKSVLAKFSFPARPGLFTIDQLGLGGWAKVQKRFFDPRSGIVAGIERRIGGSTG